MIRQGRLVLFIGGQESQNNSYEVIRLKSTKIRWFSWWPGERLDQLPSSRSRAEFSQAKAKGNYQTWVHSCDSQTGGWTVAWWSKRFKWELGNNSRQPKDLAKKWHSDSLTKSMLTLSLGCSCGKGDVEVEGVDEWESIILPQVHSTAIFRVLTLYRSCKRGRVRTVNLET
jgi:hypothetical protein